MTTNAMPESNTDIAGLELQLAGMERECPNWRHKLERSRTVNVPYGTEETSDNCKDCLDTSVVPLIEGSRRDCLGFGAQKDCPDCDGRDWIPSLNGDKVLDYMIRRGAVSFDVQPDMGILYCEWVLEALPNRPEIIAHVDLEGDMRPEDNYLVRLRAAIAGAEAMQNE